jgi:hypothetical protein
MMALPLPARPKPAAPAIIRSASAWTPRALAKAFEFKRKPVQLTGSHLDDLVCNRKVITLAPEVARKFNLKKAGYVVKKSMPIAQSICDATKQFHPACFVFFPKELA